MSLATMFLTLAPSVLEALLVETSKKSYKELSKKFEIYKLLSKLGIERPKNEDTALFLQTTLLFASKGKQKELIKLILLPDSQKAFQEEIKENKSGCFIEVLDHELHTNSLVYEIKHWNEIPILEIEEFFSIYHALVTEVQSPVETKLVNQSQDILDKLKDLTVKLDQSDGNNPLMKEYERQISKAVEKLQTGKISNALEDLLNLKEVILERAEKLLKFKVLTNIGVCYYNQDNSELAAKYLIEAHDYDPTSKTSLSNIVNAYMAIKDNEQATKYLNIFLSHFPEDPDAYSCFIKIHGETCDLAELEAKVPNILLKNPDIIAAFGTMARHKGLIQESINRLEEARLLKPEDQFIQQQLIQSYFQKYNFNFKLINLKILNEAERLELIHILELINQNLSTVAKTDLFNIKSRILMAKSFILDLLKRTDEAIATNEEGLRLDPENVLLLKQRAILMLYQKKHDEAIKILSTLRDKSTLPDAAMFLAEVYRNSGKINEGITTLEKYIKMCDDPHYKEQSKHILLDMYIQTKQKAKIRTFIVKNFRKELILDKVSLSDAYTFLGKRKIGKRLLFEAIALINKETRYKEKHYLAEALKKTELDHEAIAIYEQIAEPESHSEDTVNLIGLYQKTGNNAPALTMMKTLREKNGPIKGITNVEAATYNQLGAYETSATILIEYLGKYPDDLNLKLMLNSINLRLGNEQTVDDFFNEKIQYWKLDIETFRTYVSQFFAAKRRKQAFDIIYEYRRLKNNEEANTAYLQAVLQFPIEDNEKTEADTVDLDCAVTFKSESKTFTLIVEDRPSSELLNNEINPSHPKFMQIIGKRLGDIVEFEGNYVKWTIIEIIPKLRWAFLEGQEKNDTIYAETSVIKSFPSENLMEVIAKFTNPNWKKTFDLVIGYYKNKQIGFGLTALMLDKEPWEMWSQLRSMTDVGIMAATGTGEEFQFASSLISTDKRLVADFLSVVTLYELKILPLIESKFGKILISQSTFDLFYNYELSAWSFVREDVVNEKLEDLISSVKLYTEVQLPKSLIEINTIEKQEGDKRLGRSFHDTILLAKESDGLLLSEDIVLRVIAKQKYKVSGIWTQPLLWHLLTHQALHLWDYEDHVLSLVQLNYRHTSIREYTIVRAFSKANYTINEALRACFQIFSGKNCDLDSAVRVACGFLLILWTYNWTDKNTNSEVTHELFMALASERQFISFGEQMEMELSELEKGNNNYYSVKIIRFHLAAFKSNFGLA